MNRLPVRENHLLPGVEATRMVRRAFVVCDDIGEITASLRQSGAASLESESTDGGDQWSGGGDFPRVLCRQFSDSGHFTGR